MKGIRWWAPTATMLLLSLLSYVDRNVLALLAPAILRETRLSAQSYGWIISAFSFAYLAGNPIWGRLLDRFGVRAGLTVAAAFWSGASVAHAFASGAGAFAAARAALGFGEGATFPGGLRTATQTLSPDQHGRGLAIAYSGGSLGAIVTPIVVTPIALRYGWRGAFVFTGILGVVWLALWALVSRDSRLAPREREDAAQPPRLGDPRLWGFMAAYALGALPLGFVLYAAPLHLARGLGYDQATIGHVMWIPPLGWEVGYFYWGWVIDRARRTGAIRTAFFAKLFLGLAVLSLPLVSAAHTRSLFAFLALLFVAMFAAAGFVIGSLAEITGRQSIRHGAYLAGLGAGSWSGVMALVMPVFGWLFDRGAYPSAYAMAACAPVMGWLLWRILPDSGAPATARPEPC